MDEEGRAFFRAKGAFDDGLYPEARTQLMDLLEAYPRSRFKTEAIFLLGRSDLAVGQTERAQFYFRKILKAGANPIAEPALFYLAEASYAAGKDASALRSEALTERLRGPRGSTVRLEFEHRDGARVSAELKRRPMPSGTVGDARWLDRAAGLGHIHIRSFAESTARELDAACAALLAEGALLGLVLDLRWNTGGQLESAVEIASRFLAGGSVCTLREFGGATRELTAEPTLKRWPDLPLVLLVNSGSASGSEVLAGALRDHGAAVLVGERTYGKGIFQEVYRFRDGQFVLKFTAGEYLTPAGRALEGHLRPGLGPGGLEPDLPVAADPAQTAAIRRWQQVNWPPSALRAEVDEVFPGHFPFEPPADRVLDAALRLLQAALAPA
jgi:carboxyl-terminal processing protease